MAEQEALVEDLRVFGMPEAEIDKARAEMAETWGRTDGAFPIHRDNVGAVKLFLAMASQWRTASLGTAAKAMVVRTGIDYAALPIVAAQLGMPWPLAEGDFDRLRLLEAEACAAWRDEREAGR